MAGSDQRVGVSLHLSRQFRRWLAQLFTIRRSFSCCRETAASNDDQYLLSEPADGYDDWGEWIRRSAAKDLSECSSKEARGSCWDERSEYLQSHSDFLQKDASASMVTGKMPANMFLLLPWLGNQRNTQRHKIRTPSTQGVARNSIIKLSSWFLVYIK